MKELSIEQKARAYDEAKARMSRAYNSNRCTIGFMNEIFPELNVSEDERIRKALICHISKISTEIPVGALHRINGVDIPDILAWLEKQGQTFTKKEVDDAYLAGVCDTKQELEKQCGQNPAWSEEDEKMVNNILTPLAGRFPWNIYQPMYDWLKALKDRVGCEANCTSTKEWSVEDKSKVQRICKYLDEAKKYYADITEVRECMDWLKSLEDKIG